MTSSPLFPPDDLARRLSLLATYDVLDTPAEQGFDDIVLLATQLCNTPVALVSLVAEDRQWFKARIGFPPCETPLSQSVCAHALNEPEILVIPDLTQDGRTAANTLVTEDPSIRFYAGAVLRNAEGVAVGTLCVIDMVPRPDGLTATQTTALLALARQVVHLLELRVAIVARGKAMADLVAADVARRGHERLMREELGHRVKNLLAIVQSLVGQTLRTVANTDEAWTIIQDRISALAAAQNLLIEASSESADLETVVRAALAPHASERQLQIGGAPTRLPARSALLLALTMHELATNAIKYGALSVDEGRVDVHWTLDPATGQLNLQWLESGGPVVAPRQRQGFGSKLIERALAAEMGGTSRLEFDPAGLRFVLTAAQSVDAS